MKQKICLTDKNTVTIQLQKGTLVFKAVTDNIVRSVYTKNSVINSPTHLIDNDDYIGEFSIKQTGDTVKISTKSLTIDFDEKTEYFTWYDATGKMLFQETKRQLTEIDIVKHKSVDEGKMEFRVEKTIDGDRVSNQSRVSYVDRKGYSARAYFEFEKDEAIYGLGQAEEGIYNCRGKNQFLYQTNMRIPIPFFISEKNYGILYDCGSTMIFNDDYHGTYMFLDAVDQLDYYFIAGNKFDDLISGFRKITGKATMLPKWAFGFIQSKDTYLTQRELLDISKKYREHNIPIDCVVQDWRTWVKGKWGNKIVDKERYPDLKAAVDTMHDLNIHTMMSIWPNMNPGGEDHAEFANAKLLLPDYATYDAYKKEARDLYWEQTKREFYNAGIDSWWCDSSEGFCRDDWNGPYKREAYKRYDLVSNELKRHLDPMEANTFCVVHAKTIYDGQRGETSEKRVCNLTRSGYPSQQKYGSILWSGDISARWDVFKREISEGIRFCMSGMPYWTFDAGAYFVFDTETWRKNIGEPERPNVWFRTGEFPKAMQDFGYRELFIRMLQANAFMPVFRSHGTDVYREIWEFGERGDNLFYDAYENTVLIRYKLIPYIYSMAAWTTMYDYTILRSLLFDFEMNEIIKEKNDQFMFGPSLLICPIFKAMFYKKDSEKISEKAEIECYLPMCKGWYDFYSGTFYDGNQTVTVDVRLKEIPVFVKAGSIIPMTRPVQYAMQESEMPLEIHIYPGENCSFEYYEDDGDSYAYENGEYLTRVFDWDDENSLLTIKKADGHYKNEKETRKAVAVLFNKKVEFELTREEISIDFKTV